MKVKIYFEDPITQNIVYDHVNDMDFNAGIFNFEFTAEHPTLLAASHPMHAVFKVEVLKE